MNKQHEPDCKAPEWCGLKVLDSRVPSGGGVDGPVTWFKARDGGGQTAHCSPACRDARVPPLPAANDSGMAEKPRIEHDWANHVSGRRHCTVCGVGEYFSARNGLDGGCKRGTTPQCESFCRPGLRCKVCITEIAPAQEAPKVPVCSVCRLARGLAMRHENVSGRVVQRLTCDFCYLAGERNIAMHSARNYGTPYAGPERLPKPKLTHVGGMHDEDLRR